jgi:S1-C subfamily serine protease
MAALAAALAVALAGCGGGDGERTTTVEHVKVQDGKDSFDPAAVFDRFSNGVVTVVSLFGGSSDLQSLLGDGEAAGQGSGFVLDDSGYVATNAHVVTQGRASRIRKAREVYVQFADGNQVAARVVGVDPNSDVALLKVKPRSLKLVPLRLGSSSGVQVGEPVAAIGSPFGEEQSLSVGVVSATDRTIQALTDFQIGDAVQTDAAINRGNSGGPLLDANGQVIGINSQIKTSSGGNEGIGFAVPVDTVKRSIQQLRANGKTSYGFLGVSSQSLYPQLARRLDVPVDEGALVADVVKGGPADKAGIKGGGKETRFQATLVKLGGDVITKVNGRRITREHDLSELITRYHPGDTVTLELYRQGKRREVRVTLGERPTNVSK